MSAPPGSMFNTREQTPLSKSVTSGTGAASETGAVPFHLTLAPDESLLLVSGPNTGGKTVLLKAIGLLSSSAPWLDDADLNAFIDNAPIPFLGIGAQGDTKSAEVAHRLFERSTNEESRLLLYKGLRHGTPLFEQDPELIATIVQWFVRVL